MNYYKNFPISFIGSYGFRAELLTGTIDVPDIPGGYIVSTGCGSGKTQTIKNLIAQRYNDGILYCVDTKSEGCKMHDWIIKELIPNINRLEPDDPYRLTPDDVSIIDWDHTEELFNYFNSPEDIMYKKILIITHVRFWTDLINYFVICNPISPVETFDGDFSTLMCRNDLRKYILFDETPNFFEPFIELSSSIICNLKYMQENGVNTKDLRFVKKWYEDSYGMRPKGSDDNPFNTTTGLGRKKKDTTLSYIGKNLKKLKLDVDVARKKESDKGRKTGISKLNFYPTDLLQKNMQTMVLIWEGVGDLLFTHQTQTEDYKLFDLINVPIKYNNPVVFNEYGFNQKRRENITEEELKNTQSFWEHIQQLANIIMCSQYEKTLVVVWKDRGEVDHITIPDYYRVVKEAFDTVGVDPNKYIITYYGAADNKSTNDYMDFDSVILVGRREYPHRNIYSMTNAYSLRLSSDLANLWFYVQLITRIGIRKHQLGKKFTVYYSKDFNKKLINNLQNHFLNADVSNLDYDLPEIENELDKIIESRVNKSHRDNLRNLINEYPDLEEVILKGIPGHTINTTLKNLNKVLGLTRDSIGKYKAFVNELYNIFDINLIIS